MSFPNAGAQIAGDTVFMMLKQNKYFAGAGLLTVLAAIAPLWVFFHGDLLGAAIIAIPSALVLAICFGVAWTFREG